MYNPYVQTPDLDVLTTQDLTPFLRTLMQAIDYRALGVLVILILLDTCLGIFTSIKNGIGFDSGIGRHGLISKAVEIIVCLAFNLLSAVSSDIIPVVLVTGIYTFFILFELGSIVENLGKLGYEIPMLSRYIKVLKENNDETEVPVNKDVATSNSSTDSKDTNDLN